MGEEINTLDDIMYALKREYGLIQIKTYPEVYQRINTVEPEITYVPGKLDLSYRTERIQLIDGLPIKTYVFNPSRFLSVKSEQLHKIAVTSVVKNYDIAEVGLNPDDAYRLICDFIEYLDYAA